jgi:hypothetical protein
MIRPKIVSHSKIMVGLQKTTRFHDECAPRLHLRSDCGSHYGLHSQCDACIRSAMLAFAVFAVRCLHSQCDICIRSAMLVFAVFAVQCLHSQCDACIRSVRSAMLAFAVFAVRCLYSQCSQYNACIRSAMLTNGRAATISDENTGGRSPSAVPLYLRHCATLLA